ncbi:MAG: ferredoxin [Patescibacteria group bacterium]
MTPKVDQEKCLGCGTCVAICAEVFRMNANGKAEVIEGDHSALEAQINQAKDACPVGAITLE